MIPRSVVFAVSVFALAAVSGSSAAADYKRVEPLVSTGQTITGETIRYPEGAPAKVDSLIVTMEPGESTGWHKHGVPTYGYILEGELTVDYGDKGTKVYTPGTGFMEAMDRWHNGHNTGSAPMRVLVVFMGAEGFKNSIAKP